MKQFAMIVGLMCTAAFAAQAQERVPDVPADHRPPPGMCRIWLNNVPPGQQPAPTDCASAVRNRPANGRVLFGDDYVRSDKKKEPEKAGGLLRSFGRPLPFSGSRKPDDKKPEEKKKPGDGSP